MQKIRSSSQINFDADLNVGHKITNLSNGTANTDAVNLGQLNDAVSGLNATITGGIIYKGTLDISTTSAQTNAENILKSAKTGWQYKIVEVGATTTTADETGFLWHGKYWNQFDNLLVNQDMDGTTVNNDYIDKIDNTDQASLNYIDTQLATKANKQNITARTNQLLTIAHNAEGVITSSTPKTLAISDISGLSTELTGKAAATHTHDISDVKGTSSNAGKLLITGTASPYSVTTINTTHPTAKSTSAIYKITHDQYGLITGSTAISASDIPNLPESQITNLVSDLAGKAPTTHTHTGSQVGGFQGSSALMSAPNGTGVVESAVTGTELSHLVGARSNIQGQIDDKANLSHTHTATQITDLPAIEALRKVSTSITTTSTHVSGGINVTHTHSVVGVANWTTPANNVTAFDMYMNGLKLIPATDYTITTYTAGSKTIKFGVTGLTAGDIITIEFTENNNG